MADHTVSYSAVYHVGNLDGTRDNPSYSQEGDGVSVSRCPEDWARIAGDLGGTTYGLVNPEAVFYDAALGEARDFVYDWCLDNGFIREVEGHRLYYEELATGTERYVEFYDRVAAEVKDDSEDYPESRVEDVTSVRLDTAGREYWKRAFTRDTGEVSASEIRGLLPVWYAEHTSEEDYDGVWWHNRHEPHNYSAPRGVIFQSKLDEWDVAWTGDLRDRDRPQVDELAYQHLQT